MNTPHPLTALIPLLLSTRLAAGSTPPEQATPLRMEISTSNSVAKTGDKLVFTTTVTNTGGTATPPLILAMNIVNLEDGAPVDPEDWSPERTQAGQLLESGASAEHTWVIYSILSGNYLAYIVVMPKPASPGDSCLPVSSPGLHLSVNEFLRLNPRGMLPLLVGMPSSLGLTVLGLLWFRQRSIES